MGHAWGCVLLDHPLLSRYNDTIFGTDVVNKFSWRTLLIFAVFSRMSRLSSSKKQNDIFVIRFASFYLSWYLCDNTVFGRKKKENYYPGVYHVTKKVARCFWWSATAKDQVWKKGMENPLLCSEMSKDLDHVREPAGVFSSGECVPEAFLMCF